MNKPLPENAQWSIDELADMANRALAESRPAPAEAPDSRMAEQLTARNLRRLVSQGAIDSPERSGREAYYGPKHLEQALEARALMSRGFTSSSIQALRAASASNTLAINAASAMNLSHASLTASVDFTADAGQAWDTLAKSPMASQDSSLFPGLAEAASTACAFPSGQPPKSTAAAMDFLKSLGPEQASAPARLPGKLSGPQAGRVAPQAFYSSDRLSASASSMDIGRAYATISNDIGIAKNHSAPARQHCEVEPFPGLRINVDVQKALHPLDDRQRQTALAAIESAWEAARLSQAAKKQSE